MLCKSQEELLIVDSHIFYNGWRLVSLIELFDEVFVVVVDFVTSKDLEAHLESLIQKELTSTSSSEYCSKTSAIR